METMNLGEPSNGSSIRVDPHHNSKGHYFKKRPHLHIKRPLSDDCKYRFQLEVKTPTESDGSQTFNAIIWSLTISNTRWRKISANALNSSAKLHMKNVGTDIQLRWNARVRQLNECTLDTSVRGEPAIDHYHRSMSYFYAVMTLASKYGQPVANIYQGEESSIYLLFTYQGSNRAFIITPIGSPEWYGDQEVFYSNVDDRFLLINQGETHEWTIRIESNPVKAADGSTKYECIEYKKFKIRFNSWDNVEVT